MQEKNTEINNHTKHIPSAEGMIQEISSTYVRLSKARTYKEVLEIFSEVLSKEFITFEVSIIVFTNPDKEHGNVIASSEIKDEKTLFIDIRKYPEIMISVKEKRALFIDDIKNTDLFDDETKKVIISKNIRSIFVIPIFDMDEIIGVVFVRSEEPFYLSPFHQRYYFTQASMLTGAILNISKMNAFEQAVKKASELVKLKEEYEFLFDESTEGLMLIDREGRVNSVNKTFLKLTGYSKKEVIGRHYSVAIADDSSKLIADKIFYDFINKKFTDQFDIDIKTKAGKIKSFSIRATPLKGRKDVSLVSVRDITEEKLLSKELLKTTDLLLKTVSSSPDSIIAADKGGGILLFNEEATKLFGYFQEEVISHVNVTQLYPNNVAKEIMKMLRDSPTKYVRNYPVNVKTRIGEEIPVSLSGAIVYNDKGEEQMTVGYLRDEREKIKMEKSLDEALSRLIEAEKSETMAALAGASAHKLNQPLTVIQGYSELIIQHLKDKNDPISQYAEKVMAEVAKMSDIIKQISKITKYETKSYAGGAVIAKIGDGDNKSDNNDKPVKIPENK